MESLLVETINAVAVVTLNRPEVLNALDPPLMRRLTATLSDLAADEAVRCVVLSGAGRGFCAGGDMRASKAAAQAREKQPANDDEKDMEDRVAWLERSTHAARLLHVMRKPTIAMVNGPCAGAGLSLAAACDLRFGAQSAVLTTAYVHIGLSGDYGGSYFWTKLLGSARARELYLLGEKISAARAVEMGLLNKVWPDAQLRDRTLEVARRLADAAPAALGCIKDNILAAEAGDMDECLALEARNLILSRNALRSRRKSAD